MNGKRELNPLELSDKFMEKLSDPEKLLKFTKKMGLVTFIVCHMAVWLPSIPGSLFGI